MTHSRIVDPGHAPTPFTADEIRMGCPQGRQVTVVHLGPDETSEYWTTTFAKTDQETALLINQQVGEDGQPLGGASELVATWDELQAHASFPAINTTISEVEVATPIGQMHCLLYEVTDGPTTKRLWFAKSLPGLPIKTTYLKDDRAELETVVVRDTQAEPPDYSD